MNGVAISDDGKRGVSSSRDKSIRVWDFQHGKALHVLLGHAVRLPSTA